MKALLAEFSSSESMIAAIRALRASGTVELDAYSPFGNEELEEALGLEDRRVAAFALTGGILGGASAFLTQWYAMAKDYPLNVGNRPLFSWPSFIPITFELSVLGAALFAVISMLALNGLPRVWHPLFDIPGFERASSDRFFLLVRAFNERSRALLEEASPVRVLECELELKEEDLR